MHCYNAIVYIFKFAFIIIMYVYVSGMKIDYENNQGILNDLSNTIDDLNRRIVIAHKNINSRSEYYRTCVS